MCLEILKYGWISYAMINIEVTSASLTAANQGLPRARDMNSFPGGGAIFIFSTILRMGLEVFSAVWDMDTLFHSNEIVACGSIQREMSRESNQV